MVGVSVQKMAEQEEKGEQIIVPSVVVQLGGGGGRGADTIERPLCTTECLKVFN